MKFVVISGPTAGVPRYKLTQTVRIAGTGGFRKSRADQSSDAETYMR